MTCKMCKQRGKNWNGGDDPRCAFDGGLFSPENWNCATANAIRDIVYEGQNPMPDGVDYRYCDDQKYATVRTDQIEDLGATCMWVSWYKNRGCTDQIILLDEEDGPRYPTERECRLIIEAIPVARD